MNSYPGITINILLQLAFSSLISFRTTSIIRPILRGRDIKRYNVESNSSIILIPCGWTNKNRGKVEAEEFFKSMFPAIYSHLIDKAMVKSKGKGLFKRDDKGDYWWELRPCSYLEKFNFNKIIYIDTRSAL